MPRRVYIGIVFLRDHVRGAGGDGEVAMELRKWLTFEMNSGQVVVSDFVLCECCGLDTIDPNVNLSRMDILLIVQSTDFFAHRGFQKARDRIDALGSKVVILPINASRYPIADVPCDVPWSGLKHYPKRGFIRIARSKRADHYAEIRGDVRMLVADLSPQENPSRDVTVPSQSDAPTPPPTTISPERHPEPVAAAEPKDEPPVSRSSPRRSIRRRMWLISSLFIPAAAMFSLSQKPPNIPTYHVSSNQPDDVLGPRHHECLERDGSVEFLIEPNRARTGDTELRVFKRRGRNVERVAVAVAPTQGRYQFEIPLDLRSGALEMVFFVGRPGFLPEDDEMAELAARRRYAISPYWQMLNKSFDRCPPAR